MFEFIQYGSRQIEIFFLILIRASGLFFMAPMFSHRAIPPLIKVGVVLLLALVLVPVVDLAALPQIESVWQLAGLAFKEMLVGLIIGLLFRLTLMAADTAGSLIGYQIGFALISMPDIDEGGQISILSQFWFLTALLVFLSINGHHLVLTAFAESYELLPAGVVGLVSSAGELIIKLTAYVFVVALKMAAPVM
ncbi:MAG TPA: flagellar biosynthetic protein FliR, partial [Candidatus Deferrimicrobium sp.]|nr:flagellar biosynthetic protein FliR [Candidatus Deferrimicrobium sp.]